MQEMNETSDPKNDVQKLSFLGTFFWISFVLVLCFLAAYKMGSTVLEANEYVQSRQKVVDMLEEIGSTLKDAETGQRGFVITGDEKFLVPFESAEKTINVQLNELNRQSVKDFTSGDLDELQQLVDRKMTELRLTITLRREKGFDAAAEVVAHGSGLEIMNDLRAHLRSLEEREKTLTEQARNGSHLLSNVRTVVFGLATLMSLYVIYRAYQRIRRETEARAAQAREVDEQRQLLEVTLRSIGDAVIITDTEARITFMNRIAMDLTGWDMEEAMGKPCVEVFQIINEETRDVVESPVDKVLRLGIVVGLANHTLLIRKDGSEIPIDDSGAPIRDSEQKIRGVVLIFRDFSEHKTTARNLLQAKNDAEAANLAKDNFLASLSHELRTPLTPIAATLAAWETNPVVPKELLSQVQLMKRNVDLEARLIDDLLDLTRIVQGKLSLNSEIADLHALVVATADMYQSDIQGKRLQLRMNLDALRHHAYGDPARMQQIFWNILKNATKFTPQHGLIEITSRNLPDGHLAISFRDSGIGMSPETLEKLFQPFEQGAEEVVRRAGGLGLGMAISQALVAAQGGQIEAASDGPGKGSTFTVTMPTVEAPAHSSSSNPSQTASVGGRSCRILMVEDHPDTADVMAMLLRHVGHQVRVAQTVAAALTALSEETFDILISDVGLPDGTGVDLIREVREKYGPSMPAIALTGFGMEEDIARTREAGFNEHLTKPVNTQRLEIYIQKLTANKD